MRTARSLTVSHSIQWGFFSTPLDADPLDVDTLHAEPPGCRPPGCRPPLDADPPDVDPLVKRQTGVKTLPWPKLRLRAALILIIILE